MRPADLQDALDRLRRDVELFELRDLTLDLCGSGLLPARDPARVVGAGPPVPAGLKARMRRLLRKLALAVVTAVCGLALLEGAARLVILVGLQVLLPPDVRTWIESEKVVFDPELGWRPASSLARVDGGFFVMGEFERDETPRKVGELRGYAFGDSQTHGAGIAERSAWPGVTERVLRAEGLDVRVINLGSSGYRSAQVLRLMETYAVPQHPAFLIVDCMAGDSVELSRDYARRWAFLRRSLFESRLYRLLALGIASARGENTGPLTSVRIEQPPARTRGEGNHALIMALAASEGIPLIFLDYPFTGDPIEALAPASRLPVGAVVVGVTGALIATGRPAEELFLENNHLTVAGSEVVGNAVAEALRVRMGI